MMSNGLDMACIQCDGSVNTLNQRLLQEEEDIEKRENMSVASDDSD